MRDSEVYAQIRYTLKKRLPFNHSVSLQSFFNTCIPSKGSFIRKMHTYTSHEHTLNTRKDISYFPKVRCSLAQNVEFCLLNRCLVKLQDFTSTFN